MFLRNCWYAAALSDELLPGSPLGRTLLGEPVVLFRRKDRTAVLLEDRCCHRHAPLSRGRCEGDSIRCMYHGLRFDSSGRCVEIPGQQQIPSGMRVRAYPATEAGGWVWAWMGDPERAEPGLLPLPAWFTGTDWDMRYGQMQLKAPYTLVNDNLCDFSHSAFVHEKTFAAGQMTFAHSHPSITTLERGIRVERWITDRENVEEWLDDAQPQEAAAKCRNDQWIAYDYLAPGIMIMRVEIHAQGTAHRSGFRAPATEAIHANLGIHAATPETEQTCRYFFSIGPRSAEARITPGLPEQLFASALCGFDEDRLIIEAQQCNLERWPLEGAQTIKHDRGVLLMHAIMERLAGEERCELRPAMRLTME
jgi:phenylpropionate dioxygenase-like ring-hydroxylating dioxygenase large terminal subunit